MKRALILAIFVSLFAVSAFAQTAPKAPERKYWCNDMGNKLHPLYGNVASVAIYYYNVSGTANNVLKESFAGKESYKFNVQGHVIEFISDEIKRICKYDSSGNILEHILYGDPYEAGKTTYTYNAQKQLISSKFYFLTGELFTKDIYKYHNNGALVEKLQYSSNNEFIGKHIYKYNSQGKLVEETCYDENGVLERKTTNEYTPTGYLLRQTEAIYNKNGTLSEKDFSKYDSHGNIIELGDIKRPFKNNITYDAKGNIIGEVCIDSNGQTVEKRSYRHTYDAKGNIIKTIIFNDQMKPLELIEYRIVYR